MVSIALLGSLAGLSGCEPSRVDAKPGSYELAIPRLGLRDVLKLQGDQRWHHTAYVKDRLSGAETEIVNEEGIYELEGTSLCFNSFSRSYDFLQPIDKTVLIAPEKHHHVLLWPDSYQGKVFLVADSEYGYFCEERRK